MQATCPFKCDYPTVLQLTELGQRLPRCTPRKQKPAESSAFTLKYICFYFLFLRMKFMSECHMGMVEPRAFEVRKTQFKTFTPHFLAGWPQAQCFTFLSLRLFTHKMRWWHRPPGAAQDAQGYKCVSTAPDGLYPTDSRRWRGKNKPAFWRTWSISDRVSSLIQARRFLAWCLFTLPSSRLWEQPQGVVHMQGGIRSRLADAVGQHLVYCCLSSFHGRL